MDKNDQLITKLRMDNRGNASDQLAEKIRSRILSGEIPAGYVFPAETEFCADLGVGRSTLRDAYKALESTGFIKRIKHVGTVVNGYSDISRDAPLRTSLMMSDFDELMEFRTMIEAELARLSASRATDENIHRMEYCLDQMRAHTDDLDQLTDYDTEFHLEIAKASGNRILIAAMEGARDIFRHGVHEAFTVDTEANIAEALELHTKILDAIRHGDSERSYALMRRHIESINERRERTESAESTESAE